VGKEDVRKNASQDQERLNWVRDLIKHDEGMRQRVETSALVRAAYRTGEIHLKIQAEVNAKIAKAEAKAAAWLAKAIAKARVEGKAKIAKATEDAKIAARAEIELEIAKVLEKREEGTQEDIE